MTNPGDSDEWWKQYGGEGVAPQDVPPAPQQPTPPPAGYSSAPQFQQSPLTPPPQPQYPNYPPPQAANYTPPQANPAPYGQPQGYPGAPVQPGYGGYPGYQPYPAYGVQGTGTNGLATASLIVSIIGLPSLFFCVFIPLISIVGLVLGIVSLNQLKTSGQQGRGLALGGVWVGAIGTVIGIALLVVLVSLGHWSSSY
ncbi:DUF4190 domain-containing protein [Nocardia sp. NBC_00511]|uniref:DUF4190 domain-containing protein n=1 Tax=Nocardia sp. NBC_00511 TaxID=2903591 RepID=UPI0030DEF028